METRKEIMISSIDFLGMDRTDFADKENMAPQQQQLQQQQQQMLLQQQQVIWVVNFTREVYKFRNIFGQKQISSKEVIVFCELT